MLKYVACFLCFIVIKNTAAGPFSCVINACLDPLQASKCLAEGEHPNCATKALGQVDAFEKDALAQNTLFTNKFFTFLEQLSPQERVRFKALLQKQQQSKQTKQKLSADEKQFLATITSHLQKLTKPVTITGESVAKISDANAYFIAAQTNINFSNISMKRLARALQATTGLNTLQVSFYQGRGSQWIKKEHVEIDKVVQGLKNQKDLHSIKIDATNLDMPSLAKLLTALWDLGNLREISIINLTCDGTPLPELVSAFKGLAFITNFAAINWQGSTSGALLASVLPSLPAIESLDLSGSNLAPSIQNVFNVLPQKVTAMNLSHVSLGGYAPQILTLIKGAVKSLDLSYVDITPEMFQKLPALKLTSLTLGTFADNRRQTLNIKAFTDALSLMKTLKTLVLFGFRLQKGEHAKLFAALKNVGKNLTSLTLRNMKLIGAEVDGLKDLTQLQSLDVSQNQFGRTDVWNVFLKLRDLQRLDISQNESLGRVGIVELALGVQDKRNPTEPLPHLRWLSFTDSGVSPADLEKMRNVVDSAGKVVAHRTLVILPSPSTLKASSSKTQ